MMAEGQSSPALAASGFEHLPGYARDEELAVLMPAFDALGGKRAGERLAPHLLRDLPVMQRLTTLAVARLGSAARPVRGLLFDKRAGGNWSLAWHQDRTVEVRERIEAPGYGPWTIKAGRQHVAPPATLLARMMTVRLHCDPVDDDNAPLLVAPGSHRRGLIPEPEIAAVVEQCGRHACLAARGDLWLYSTLILHASDAARRPRHRRVVQVDFSADVLPSGLQWAADV